MAPLAILPQFYPEKGCSLFAYFCLKGQFHLSPRWVKWQLQINHSHMKVNTGKKSILKTEILTFFKHFITQEYTKSEHNFKKHVFFFPINIYWTIVPWSKTNVPHITYKSSNYLWIVFNKNSHYFCHDSLTINSITCCANCNTYAFNIYSKTSTYDIKLHIPQFIFIFPYLSKYKLLIPPITKLTGKSN